MQWNDVYYFAEEKENLSPFIYTLLRETSKTDRIWTLRCGKRKNILAKQINSALRPEEAPWGRAMLRPSQPEALASTSLPSPSQSDEVWRWSITYWWETLLPQRDEEDRLHSAAVWGSTLTGFCAHIQSEQISNPLSTTTQHSLSARRCSQDVYFFFRWLLKGGFKLKFLSVFLTIMSQTCTFCGTQMLTFLKNLRWFFFTWWQCTLRCQCFSPIALETQESL